MTGFELDNAPSGEVTGEGVVIDVGAGDSLLLADLTSLPGRRCLLPEGGVIGYTCLMTMQHDFSDSDYCDALLNLFKPGNGVRPPSIGGRVAEQTLLSRYLRTAQGEADDHGCLKSKIPHDIVLYGPRGNGKTVLIDEFEQASQAKGAAVVPLTPDELDSPLALARHLLGGSADQDSPDEAPEGIVQEGLAKGQATLTKSREAMTKAVREQGLQVEQISASLPFASVSWAQMSPDEKLARLGGLLLERCRGKERPPLVISLDEAHNLDPEVGNKLLNLSQKTRRKGGRFLLVLAGTPNLETHLGKMDVTFWDRSEIVPLGRLDAAGTRAALVAPLAGLSIRFDRDALDRVVADSQHYPYFIQLWGKALCEVLVNTKQGQQITASVADEAWTAVEKRRGRYYSGRYNEMKKQKLLPAARALAGAFEKHDVLHRGVLLGILSRELGLSEDAGQDCLGELSDLGYIWRPGAGNDYEPGIPSLMTYVCHELQHEASAKAAFKAQVSDAEDRNDGGGDTPKGMGQGQT